MDSVKIPLSNGGGYAFVSPEDFERVSAYKWYLSKEGYVRCTTKIGTKGNMFLHRFILQVLKEIQIDHINRKKTDNRRSNLRIATQKDNVHNTGKIPGTLSKYKGLSYDKRCQKWYAQINIGKKQTHLGAYEIEEDAARAYDSAALYYFGELAVLNFTNATSGSQLHKCNPMSAHELIQMSRKKRGRYTGAYYKKSESRWYAKISVNKKIIYLGSFDSEEAAARAYDEAALNYHGAKAKLNFPQNPGGARP